MCVVIGDVHQFIGHCLIPLDLWNNFIIYYVFNLFPIISYLLNGFKLSTFAVFYEILICSLNWETWGHLPVAQHAKTAIAVCSAMHKLKTALYNQERNKQDWVLFIILQTIQMFSQSLDMNWQSNNIFAVFYLIFKLFLLKTIETPIKGEYFSKSNFFLTFYIPFVTDGFCCHFTRF